MSTALGKYAELLGAQAPSEGRPTKRFRVTVIEWLSHSAYLDASSAEVAEAIARELWANKAETDVFCFEDCGIDGVDIEEVLP